MFKQTRTRSRLLAILLALVLCLGTLPGTAWASTAWDVSTGVGELVQLCPVVITDAAAQDSAGNFVEAKLTSGTMVTIPEGVSRLTLAIRVGESSSYTFSPNMTANPLLFMDVSGEDCGLTPTQIGGTGGSADGSGITDVTLLLEGSSKKGMRNITFTTDAFMPRPGSDGWYEINVEDKTDDVAVVRPFSAVAPAADAVRTLSTGSPRIALRGTMLTIKVEESAPSNPQADNFRIDFFPNGGTIKSIRGYESSKIYAGSTLAQEQNIFVDRNSGIGMIMTGKTGQLDCFPVVERDGYTFDGWYKGVNTDKDGNVTGGIKVDLSERFTTDAGLTAKWTKASAETDNTHEVWFHLNGGKVTSVLGVSTSKMTDGVLNDAGGNFIYREGPDEGTEILGEMLTGKDGKLAGLPVIEKDGYTFDGWYTMETGGNKVTADNTFTGSGQYGRDYLWARWTPAKDTCTVTFRLNGAPGKAPEAQKVAKGGTIKLPEDPKWTGYAFQGWVSGDISGNTLTNLVHWTNTTKVTKDVTLYANWVEDTADSTLKGLTYRFGNHWDYYGYSQTFKIPLERYKLVFGDNQLAKTLYDRAVKWNGSCYGMSSTSAMFFEKVVSTTSFKAGSAVPYDLAVADQNSAWNLTLTQYIEAMQISQKAQRVQKQISENANNLDALVSAVKSAPVIVTMYGPDSGHAVVGYAVEEGNGVMIYDPNYPNQSKSITLADGGWKYDDMGWSSSNGWISYVPYTEAAQVWSGRGSDENYYDTMNLVSVSADSATITNSAGKVVATIQDGRASASQSGVYPIHETDSAAGSSASAPALWLPTGEYTVTNKGGKSLQVTMTNVDQSAAVTTSASSVTLLVDDSRTTNSVRLAGAGKSYDITLSSTLDKGSREVKLTGTTDADTTAAAQIAGKLYGTNLDAKGTIQVDGKNAGSDILAGSVPDTGAAPSQPSFPFTDVGEGRWYRPYVQAAYEAGLVNGVTPTTYEPDKTLTLAESVTLAARICAEARGETAPSGGTPWYKAAYDYCVERGVLDSKVFALSDMTRTATRYEMVTILDGAVPEERMKETVEVAKDGIPDLKEADAYGEVVYRWYRAGLIGGDADGSFNGSRDIKRSEVAKILCTINKLA